MSRQSQIRWQGFGAKSNQDVFSIPVRIIATTKGISMKGTRGKRSDISLGPRCAMVRGASASIRHTGLFSAWDVEVGEPLPSYEEPHAFGVLTGPATQTAIPRVGKRFIGSMESAAAPISITTISNARPPPGFPSGLGLRQGHSRQGSQASLSSASSPGHGQMSNSLELPQNSKTLVDKKALDAMKVAVEAAPGVWDLMEEILAEMLESQPNVRQLLTMAKAVTQRLQESIRAVQQGDVTAGGKQLLDDAHIFGKVRKQKFFVQRQKTAHFPLQQNVVQLSNVIKHHGAGHASYPSLRSKMVTLTNSTEEFVILLHVSSFAPSPAPRPYSPMTNGPGPGFSPGEDVRQPSSLSPSRSTQAEGRRKLASPGRDGEVPRIALGGQHSAGGQNPRLGGGLSRDMSG